MTATAVAPPATTEAAIPFTLLKTGRAIRRSNPWLRDQWRRLILPRLAKTAIMEPEQADFIFEDIMRIHEPVRTLLGGEAHIWDLPKETIEAAAQHLIELSLSKEALPTPKYLIMILEHLLSGNPSPAMETIIKELRAQYGENPPDTVDSLSPIPEFILKNRVGRASLVTYMETNPATVSVPTTTEEVIRSVYTALLFSFVSEKLGNHQKLSSDFISKYNLHSQLKMRLTVEPHAFLCLGHMSGVDAEACFGAGGSNSRYAVLLAAQPNSVICQIGYTREDSKKFVALARAWGRLHEEGIMLSNFYPKRPQGHYLGQLVLLATCFPKGNFPPASLLSKALHIQQEASNSSATPDPCLWSFRGYATSPLYHNGDAIWFPLSPVTKKPPGAVGRVPAAYSEAPWSHPFQFPTYTE